jgi:hypothetical protein
MQYLILGASAGGLSAASAIRKRDPTARIQILSDESRPPYYRPLIPYLLTGEKGEMELQRQAHGMPPDSESRLPAVNSFPTIACCWQPALNQSCRISMDCQARGLLLYGTGRMPWESLRPPGRPPNAAVGK